jgi:hypothetical protein
MVVFDEGMTANAAAEARFLSEGSLHIVRDSCHQVHPPGVVT